MNEFWDRLGISASLICILHCLLTPILIVLLPITGSYLAHGWFHAAIAALVIPVALWALINGYRAHRHTSVLAYGLAGLVLVCLALLQHHDIQREFILMIIGGSFLTFAHYQNLKCCRVSRK